MIHFIVSHSPKAQEKADLFKNVKTVSAEDADVFVVFGGDGFMLHSIRDYKKYNKPFYGINCGHVGFLMNELESNLEENVQKAIVNTVHPIKFKATKLDGTVIEDYAVNEIALMRHGPLASSIDVSVNDKKRIICKGDGILLSTPAGSTAYNSSAGGPILPLSAHLLVLTPLCVYSPKHWKGAILKDDSKLLFNVFDPVKRPVCLTYDNLIIHDIEDVEAYQDKSIGFDLLFAPDTSLEERILKEQFLNFKEESLNL